ncbi:hypothetical protein C4577_02130 [Candidatus Parcubacteria bacterium]|nr:MAG: hypothetical protein C4577_02130 [Candidatus Parcubacteria bacterium]
MKQTLWQWLTTPKPVVEPRVPFNPLELGPKNFVTIKFSDFDDKMYVVTSVQELTRKINGNEHKFADYFLEYEIKLRAYPEGQILALKRIEDLEYNEEVHEICKSGSEFTITDHDNNDEQSTYWRIGDVKNSHNCTVFVGSGGKDFKMEYWDYSRITKDEADQDVEEYLFIEMDKDSGRFQMWLGKQIGKDRLSII